MKKNDFAEIKNLDIKAIEARVVDAKKELGGLLIDKNMNKLKDLKALDKKRKDIARMMTVMTQKLEMQKLEESLKNTKEGSSTK